jgi:amino acid transporter
MVTDSRRLKKTLFTSAVLVALLNFFALGVISTYLGGDALNGYVRAGHYVVCAHGRCYEVSRSVWQFSYWQALTALAGMALFVGTALVYKFMDFMRKKSGDHLGGDA